MKLSTIIRMNMCFVREGETSSTGQFLRVSVSRMAGSAPDGPPAQTSAASAQDAGTQCCCVCVAVYTSPDCTSLQSEVPRCSRGSGSEVGPLLPHLGGVVHRLPAPSPALSPRRAACHPQLRQEGGADTSQSTPHSEPGRESLARGTCYGFTHPKSRSAGRHTPQRPQVTLHPET